MTKYNENDLKIVDKNWLNKQKRTLEKYLLNKYSFSTLSCTLFNNCIVCIDDDSMRINYTLYKQIRTECKVTHENKYNGIEQ